jgi:hypothetical protein
MKTRLGLQAAVGGRPRRRRRPLGTRHRPACCLLRQWWRLRVSKWSERASAGKKFLKYGTNDKGDEYAHRSSSAVRQKAMKICFQMSVEITAFRSSPSSGLVAVFSGVLRSILIQLWSVSMIAIIGHRHAGPSPASAHFPATLGDRGTAVHTGSASLAVAPR